MCHDRIKTEDAYLALLDLVSDLSRSAVQAASRIPTRLSGLSRILSKKGCKITKMVIKRDPATAAETPVSPVHEDRTNDLLCRQEKRPQNQLTGTLPFCTYLSKFTIPNNSLCAVRDRGILIVIENLDAGDQGRLPSKLRCFQSSYQSVCIAWL